MTGRSSFPFRDASRDMASSAAKSLVDDWRSGRYRWRHVLARHLIIAGASRLYHHYRHRRAKSSFARSRNVAQKSAFSEPRSGGVTRWWPRPDLVTHAGPKHVPLTDSCASPITPAVTASQNFQSAIDVSAVDEEDEREQWRRMVTIPGLAGLRHTNATPTAIIAPQPE